MEDLALRLLELEQRFNSYCVLHEEELAEIRHALQQLREDILRLHQDLRTQPGGHSPADSSDDAVPSSLESFTDLSL